MLYFMMTTTQLRKVAKAHFETKSRKFRVVARNTYTLCNYWDGGTREYAAAINLQTGQIRDAAELTTNPMNGAAHSTVVIPSGVAIIVHGIYCGQDCGISVYLPEPATLQAESSKALLSEEVL